MGEINCTKSVVDGVEAVSRCLNNKANSKEAKEATAKASVDVAKAIGDKSREAQELGEKIREGMEKKPAGSSGAPSSATPSIKAAAKARADSANELLKNDQKARELGKKMQQLMDGRQPVGGTKSPTFGQF